MTKIALVSPYTLPSACGNSFLAERLKAGLSRRGFEVSLFNSGKDDPDQAAPFRPDLVHSLNADRPFQWMQELRKRCEAPWVITLTGTDYNSWCGVRDPSPHIRWSLEAADALVVFHREASDDLTRCSPSLQAKLHIIPQGITPLDRVPDVDIVRQQAGVDRNHVVFLMVASLRPVKHLGLAVTAFRKVEKEMPGVKLLLIGPAMDREESEAVLKAGSTLKCFTYLGEQPRDHARRHMQAADVFLNTSLNEGMSGALLEAMAEGLPLLATDVTGNRTLVKHETNGLLFPSGDAEALANTALQLAADPSLRRRLGKAGREIALSRYSVDQEADRYEKLYEQVLRATGRSSHQAQLQQPFLT